MSTETKVVVVVALVAAAYLGYQHFAAPRTEAGTQSSKSTGGVGAGGTEKASGGSSVFDKVRAGADVATDAVSAGKRVIDFFGDMF